MLVTNKLRILSVAAVAFCATSMVMAGDLSSIGVLPPGPSGVAKSVVNALSADGKYAVGYSNAVVSYMKIDGTMDEYVGPVAVVWNEGVLTQLPLFFDGFGFQRASETIATGVVVLQLDGMIGIGGGIRQTIDPFKMQMYVYEAPLNNLGGGAWRDNRLGFAGIVGPYNTARIKTTTAGNQWYIAGDRSGSDRDYVNAEGPDSVSLDHRNGGPDCVSNSVNGTGHTAGYDKGNPGNMPRALYMNFNNGTTQTIIPQPANVISSEAFGISPHHNVVILCGNVATITANQAFVWEPGDAAMTLLGTLPGDTQSTAISVNKIGNNFITVGFSSDGTTEDAVIWDTTGTWSSSGQATLLTDALVAAGIDVSQWTSLTRATSVSDNGKTIAGYGVWAADGSTRGFVADLSKNTQIDARRVFYNNCFYDGNNVGINAGTGSKTDSDAIDTTKSPLMIGGGASTFANWTGYNKGLNGLIYDISDPEVDPVASDFVFEDAGRFATGATLVNPSAVGMIVLQASSPRKVRMVFTFADGSLKNTWLKVTIGTGFGLPASETHFWGNAAGDTGTGNVSPNVLTNASDELAARSNPTTAINRSPVTDRYDINKTSLVDGSDQLWIRSNPTTSLTCLKFVTK